MASRFATTAGLEALAGVVKATIHSAGFGADSCIAATRTVVDVLKRFDTRAKALTVRVMVVNPAFVDRATREAPPHTREGLDCWEKESGAYALNIGTGEAQPGKWAGHLVAVSHLLRIAFGASVVVQNTSIPMWASWIAFAVTAYLGYQGITLRLKST
jgi:hypothetical protein